MVAESDDAPSSQTLIATDDGAPTGSSASTVEDAAASSGDGTTGPSGQQSDPDPAEKPVEIAASDSGPEFALEIVEPTELDLEPQGGAHQESPVASAEPGESGGGSGAASSAQGDVYTWQDGDRTVGARL